MPFTDEEKLAEISRELELRHRVYRWQVRNGKMTQEQANRQIGILVEVKLDYAAKVTANPGPLFG
jgi:hypothetical protein